MARNEGKPSRPFLSLGNRSLAELASLFLPEERLAGSSLERLRKRDVAKEDRIDR